MENLIERIIMYILKAILLVVYSIVFVLGACIVAGLTYGMVVETIKHFNPPPKVEE